MEHIEIRETMPEDAEKLIAYLKKVGAETDNLTFGKEGLSVTVEQEKAYLTQVHEEQRSVHYSVWKEGELIADGSLSGLPRRMSHYAELGLSVIKAQWNQGIGGRLLEELIAYARQASIEIIRLEVRSDNAGAIHLYEKYGFKRVGMIPGYFKINDTYVDFVMMCLDLRG
mgnify:CR=1 FL=1